MTAEDLTAIATAAEAIATIFLGIGTWRNAANTREMEDEVKHIVEEERDIRNTIGFKEIK